MTHFTRLVAAAALLCAAASAQDLILKSEFSLAKGWRSNNVFPRLMADVNGDGKRDIIGFAGDGVWVSLFGSSWVPARPTKWLAAYALNAGGWTTYDEFPRHAADVNGDGKADIVGFATDGVYVSLSSGGKFTAPAKWLGQFSTGQGWKSQNTTPRFVADVNGDGRADVIGFATDGVYVATSTGTGFAPMAKVSDAFRGNGGFSDQDHFPRMVADVDGDGVGDLVGFATNGVWVALSTKTTFGPAENWGASFAAAADKSTNVEPRMIFDVNYDGKGDLITVRNDGIFVALSNGKSFGSPARWYDRMTMQGGGWKDQDTFPRFAGDFDGDGYADMIGFASDGVYVSRNTGKSLFAPQDGVAAANAGDSNSVSITTGTLMTYPPVTPPAYTMADLVVAGPSTRPEELKINGIAASQIPGRILYSQSNAIFADQKATITCMQDCGTTFADYTGKPILDSTQTQVCPAFANLQPLALRRSGVPFLSTHDNACYACPVTDTGGLMIITQADGVNSTPASVVARGLALADGKNVFGGPVCKISQVGKNPAGFLQPGLSGMRTSDLLVERKIFDNPDAIAAALDALGKNRSIPNYNTRAYLEQEWPKLAAKPFAHDATRAIMLNILLSAASKPNRTPAEQAFVEDMQRYIGDVRTRGAKAALDYYDSWNLQMTQRARDTHRYAYYDLSPRGFVPEDYTGTILGGLAAGVTGLGVATSVGIVAAYTSAMVAAATAAPGAVAVLPGGIMSLASIVGVAGSGSSGLPSLSIGVANLARAVMSGGQLAAGASLAACGPVIVVTAASAILTAWITQWQAIENARPTLVTALDTAKLPVDLRVLVATETGPAEITSYYAMAMETGESEASDVVALAAKAAGAAKAKGYTASN